MSRNLFSQHCFQLLCRAKNSPNTKCLQATHSMTKNTPNQKTIIIKPRPSNSLLQLLPAHSLWTFPPPSAYHRLPRVHYQSRISLPSKSLGPWRRKRALCEGRVSADGWGIDQPDVPMARLPLLWAQSGSPQLPLCLSPLCRPPATCS